MNICILSASPRKNSQTMRLTQRMKQILIHEGVSNIHVIGFDEYDIPFMAHADVDIENMNAFQQKIFDRMSDANLVIILSPEYNWMPSSELINFFHQMADKPFRKMWDEKVFAIAGVSSGRGGRFPTVQITYILNKIIGFMNFNSVVSPRVFESQFTGKSIDEDGNSLGNEEYEKGLTAFIHYSLKTAKRWMGK